METTAYREWLDAVAYCHGLAAQLVRAELTAPRRDQISWSGADSLRDRLRCMANHPEEEGFRNGLDVREAAEKALGSAEAQITAVISARRKSQHRRKHHGVPKVSRAEPSRGH